jgi:hypothetical protein
MTGEGGAAPAANPLSNVKSEAPETSGRPGLTSAKIIPISPPDPAPRRMILL